jgi:hypothetical protein
MLDNPGDEVFGALAARLGLHPEFKVLGPVVGLDPIAMVDVLERRQRATEGLFHHDGMLEPATDADVSSALVNRGTSVWHPHQVSGAYIATVTQPLVVDKAEALLVDVGEPWATWHLAWLRVVEPTLSPGRLVMAGTESTAVVTGRAAVG